MIFEVLISLVFLTGTIIYLKWSFRYWKNRNVHVPEPSLPFGNVGQVLSGKENLGGLTTDLYNTLKAKGLPYGGFHFVFSPMFIPANIDLLRRILITDFQHFTDHFKYIEDENDPLTAHLFSLNGAKWKALRAKLTPLFTSGRLKTMFQTFVDCTDNFPYVLDEAIKRGEPLDIKDTFARYTTDIIGSVAFGIDCNCLKNPNTDNEFRTYGKKVFENGFREAFVQIINLASPKLMKLLGLKVMKPEVERFFMNMVKETIDYRDKNNYHRNDFLQLLMELRNTEIKADSAVKKDDSNVAYNQHGLTVEEIAAQAFVFFAAGFETSSTTLTFLMYELVQNLDVQEKLREEIKTVLKAHDGKITYEAVQEMSFLDKCINETLRKYPPLPITPRVCTKDYKIPDTNLTIKKGTGLLIPLYGIHHDPEYYPDPEKFDPERFSETNKQKRPHLTFIPFGEGPRICIGLRMGLLQAKVGLVALIKDYRYTLNSKTKIPIEFKGRQIVLTLKDNIWIDAKKA